MNTIKQAREAASRIWTAGYVDESATIDALIAELEKVTVERDHANDVCDSYVAELASIKQQEPVMIYEGRCIIDCGDAGHQDVTMLKLIPKGAKLYLAAGAQAIEGTNNEQVRSEVDAVGRQQPLEISSDCGNDNFNGGNAALVAAMVALVNLSDAGALVPNGIGGHARTLLTAAAARLAAGAQPVQEQSTTHYWIHKEHCFQPPYDHSCKYDDDDCPMAAPVQAQEQRKPLTMIEMVDAAMSATADIYPPITRSQCKRIIQAAHNIKEQP